MFYCFWDISWERSSFELFSELTNILYWNFRKWKSEFSDWMWLSVVVRERTEHHNKVRINIFQILIKLQAWRNLLANIFVRYEFIIEILTPNSKHKTWTVNAKQTFLLRVCVVCTIIFKRSSNSNRRYGSGNGIEVSQKHQIMPIVH